MSANMAKTRQPLTFKGRWMTFGRSLRGEVLSVTYFPAAQVKDKPLSPRPTYRTSEGSLRVQKEIDYDTVCPEIKPGRKGWRANEFTSIAFQVWEQQGNLTLISKTELDELDSVRKEGVGRKQKESNLKRRRNEVKYTSTQAKKQKTSHASPTPLSTERKAEVRAIFESREQMNAQDLTDFIQMEKLKHKNHEAPTYETIRAAREWSNFTHDSPYSAPVWFLYQFPVSTKKNGAEELLRHGDDEACEVEESRKADESRKAEEAEKANGEWDRISWRDMIVVLEYWVPHVPKRQKKA